MEQLYVYIFNAQHTMSLLHDAHTSEAPEAFLDQQGTVFARFGSDTQDSGNISYGVQVDNRRFFVKTAGAPSDAAFLNHEQRVYWLNNARSLASTLQDPILPRLFNAVASPHGPDAGIRMGIGRIRPHGD